MLAKMWFEDGQIKCCSSICTQACPRFDFCSEVQMELAEDITEMGQKDLKCPSEEEN